MRSAKQRSRSKSNRPKTLGNIVNRVFDSSGPDGKVRGTPQQIIEKYQVLARDAQLSNDRVAAENFQQHAEHYTRLLAQAQREMQAEAEARRLQNEERNRQLQEERNRHQQRRQEDDRSAQDDAAAATSQPVARQDHGPARQDHQKRPDTQAQDGGNFSVQGNDDNAESTLVDTPESRPADAAPANTPENIEPKKPTRVARRKPAVKTDSAADGAAEKPKPRRNTRRSPKSESGKASGKPEDADPSDNPGSKASAAE